MQHFLEIENLSLQEINHLISKAMAFKKGEVLPDYSQKRMATLFYENSTRTRISFEIAAQNLSIPVIHFDNALSSEIKGESFEDTMANLMAMGIDLFVIRQGKARFYETLKALCSTDVHLINAGDGTHEHPSQAMLDLMTILEHRPQLSTLKIAVTGNISHSRVANSLQILCKIMAVGELVLVAPPVWQPTSLIYGRVTGSLEEGLDKADVVICLRIQKERLKETEFFELEAYKKHFSLTSARLATAKKDLLIMHPGPVNRGIEVDAAVADSKNSLILQQVKNGVFMRMAIMDALFGE
jgi:aspartate carbamoyltransferase catalytic subunit